MRKDPFTAPGDKFGTMPKAQSLVAWITRTLPEVYRPPFDPWDEDRARNVQYSVIEVYPTASMESRLFQNLLWPLSAEKMGKIGDSDIAMLAMRYDSGVLRSDSKDGRKSKYSTIPKGVCSPF